jgi:hypothetical protein
MVISGSKIRRKLVFWINEKDAKYKEIEKVFLIL